jgi:hypothetical protein
MLDRVAATWTLDDAEAWWSRHERGQHAAETLSASAVVAATVAAGAEVTRDSRAPATPSAPSAAPSSAAPSSAAPPSTGSSGPPATPPQGSRTVSQGLDQTAFFDTSDDE